MKSVNKKLNLEMFDKICDQIHYELVTYKVRYKVVKEVQVKLNFVYSLRLSEMIKVRDEV